MSWGLAYYALEWAIRITALLIVPVRKPAATATSWLLLIFFLPVPGIVLYLAIGSASLPRWRTRQFTARLPEFSKLANSIAREDPDGSKSEDLTEKVVANSGLMPAIGGNNLELLVDYQAMIDQLVTDIDEASERVHMVAYIFASDSTGKKVVAALERAVKRGVQCRVLVDPIGSAHWFREIQSMLRGIGVDVRATLALHSLRRWTRRDLRNHRKLYLIDGDTAYVGSQNIVAADFRPGIVNQEVVVRSQGPVVAELEAIFAVDWQNETGEWLGDKISIPKAAGNARLQVLASGPDFSPEGFRSLLLQVIHSACSRILIVTPYLIPDPSVLAAMKLARLRGVEIVIAVSRVRDHPIVHLAQESYYSELLDIGVQLVAARDGLLHAKVVVSDRQVGVVGSGNLDIRSLILNDELSLVIYDEASIAALAETVERMIESAGPISRTEWDARPKLARVVENLARLTSPLL
ncbi:cardiolipin synthase [Qipengyuania zhejiangensis]|uniref:cardiolipin synthase n=1 Tax=Qipengyuania zhejiangensis TaxID=3077782 RepID=UPI002D795178|nr:cardiolipin synthase [Qipengyuania sp. Z2]